MLPTYLYTDVKIAPLPCNNGDDNNALRRPSQVRGYKAQAQPLVYALVSSGTQAYWPQLGPSPLSKRYQSYKFQWYDHR